jgi:hypothetical protein
MNFTQLATTQRRESRIPVLNFQWTIAEHSQQMQIQEPKSSRVVVKHFQNSYTAALNAILLHALMHMSISYTDSRTSYVHQHP